MKKLFSTGYTNAGFDLALFLLRAGFGFLLFLNHGLVKLQNFSEWKNTFSDPLHIGHTPSLVLDIFGEVVCSLLIVLGLMSRLASFVLVVMFCVIIFIVHKTDPINKKELPILFLLAFLTTLFCGPGRWSTDKLIGK